MNQRHQIKNIEEISLDTNNPRFPKNYSNLSQDEVIDLLYKNYNLNPLISDISQGIFEDVEPIAVIKKNNVYIALEGNRRLASKKILCSDKLIKKYNLHIHESFLSFQVPIYIFDTRKSAEIYLQRRHVTKAESWETLPKVKFFYESYINSNKKNIDIFDLYRINNLADKFQMSKSSAKNSLINYLVFSVLAKVNYFNINNLNPMNIDASILTTALSNPTIRNYIGLKENLNSYDQRSLIYIEKSINIENLSKLIHIIYEKLSNNTTLLGESRNLKKLSKILESEKNVEHLFISKSIETTFDFAKTRPKIASNPDSLDLFETANEKISTQILKREVTKSKFEKKQKLVSTIKGNQLKRMLDSIINATNQEEIKEYSEKIIVELVKLTNKYSMKKM